jgi:hypothetical protein
LAADCAINSYNVSFVAAITHRYTPIHIPANHPERILPYGIGVSDMVQFLRNLGNGIWAEWVNSVALG